MQVEKENKIQRELGLIPNEYIDSTVAAIALANSESNRMEPSHEISSQNSRSSVQNSETLKENDSPSQEYDMANDENKDITNVPTEVTYGPESKNTMKSNILTENSSSSVSLSSAQSSSSDESEESDKSIDRNKDNNDLLSMVFPKGPSKNKQQTVFNEKVCKVIKSLAEFSNEFQSSSNTESKDVIVFSLLDFVDREIDRPEIVELAIKRRDMDDYHYKIHYAPSIALAKEKDLLKPLLLTLFKDAEHGSIEKVFKDKNTQALSLMYYVSRNGMVEYQCISTILFRLCNTPKETEPFIFVYYRATNSTPLSEREQNDIYYAKCKFSMENLGIGYKLLRIAQQLLCENDEHQNSYRMYLVATDDLFIDHYSKIGFKIISFDEDPSIYKNVPEELNECLALENFSPKILNLLVFERPFEQDKICYRRKLARHHKVQAIHVNKNLIELEESKTKRIMEDDIKKKSDPISDAHAQQLFDEYLERYEENMNPFAHLVPEIESGTKLEFSTIVDRYHNLLSVEDIDDSDDDDENDAVPKLDMSYVDKTMLKQFELRIRFDGAIHGDTITKCKMGNIFCSNCKQFILLSDAPFVLLKKFGANIMHYHLLPNTMKSGIITESSWESFEKLEGFDKASDIIQCQRENNRDLCKHLFRAMNLDCGYDEDTLQAVSTRCVGFVQSVLKLFYCDTDSMYVHYLKKCARKYKTCIERIQFHVRKTFKQQKKRISPELEIIMKEYISLSSKRHINRDYAERQQDLVTSITTNPKKKPNYQPMTPYRGYDMSIYKTAKERNKIREYYLDRDIKLNWQTVELVNTDERNLDEQPLTPLSEQCHQHNKKKHWLGKSNYNGTDTYFLVSDNLIPEDYTTDPGLLFKAKFFEKIKPNVEVPINQTIRNKLKKAYEEYENSALTSIKLIVNKKTNEKSWWGKTVDNKLVKADIDEPWLEENFKDFYSSFYHRIISESNLWIDVPAGSRDSTVGNLKKIEDVSYVSIYLPRAYKCTFANLANALYAIHDFEAAKFFEKHMDSDIKMLVGLLKSDGGKRDMNQFQLAAHLIQSQFGYQLLKMKKTDNLVRPVPANQIKYVMLMPRPNGSKHVIAIAGNKIYDCENKKVLTLCEENIAWCGSRTVEELLSCKRTILAGFILELPLIREDKMKLKRKIELMEESCEGYKKNILEVSQTRIHDMKLKRKIELMEESCEEYKKKLKTKNE